MTGTVWHLQTVQNSHVWLDQVHKVARVYMFFPEQSFNFSCLAPWSNIEYRYIFFFSSKHPSASLMSATLTSWHAKVTLATLACMWLLELACMHGQVFLKITITTPLLHLGYVGWLCQLFDNTICVIVWQREFCFFIIWKIHVFLLIEL